MNQKYRKWIIAALIVLTVLCLAFIFGNSLKDSEESSEQSMAVKNVIDDIARMFGFGGEIDVSKLRGFAHVAEFFMLGVCLAVLAINLAIKQGNATASKLAKFICILMMFGIGAAVADEMLQGMMSEGRVYDIADIGLDSLGIVLGTLSTAGGYYIFLKLRASRRSRKTLK